MYYLCVIAIGETSLEFDSKRLKSGMMITYQMFMYYLSFPNLSLLFSSHVISPNFVCYRIL